MGSKLQPSGDVSLYERDDAVPAAWIETFRGMRRRCRRGEQATAHTPSHDDLERIRDQ